MQFNECKQRHKRLRWHVYQIFELNKLKCEITKMTVQATKMEKNAAKHWRELTRTQKRLVAAAHLVWCSEIAGAAKINKALTALSDNRRASNR